jgi:hypothetical protein
VVDIRIKLSALWAARMLSGLQGDSTRLHDPVAMKEIMAGTSAVRVTSELLLMMSLIFAVPIFMSCLSLTLKDPSNRWANRVIGVLFALFDLVFLGLVLFSGGPFGYEAVWSFVYPTFTASVVWYAWRWPKKEA